ncbi:hypothetical protein [Desulfosoma caldarium]|uniref:hypothetical protein n=1 Tax=Desulfosoma caldarium TaxID=610254 RepID=UPI000F475AB4|nr:hypothetical protein [Desulfosoma caldarium]
MQKETVNPHMSVRWRILAIRSALGLVFALVLGHFFFPDASGGRIAVFAVLLVFSAYILEALRAQRK